MKKITIYTDGSCSGNPGPGGYAAVLICGGVEKEVYGGERATTNNRMELTAVIKALEQLKEPCEVELYSDSQYFINAVTKGWLKKWAASGYVKADKQPVLNRDLWETLLPMLEKHKINCRWVKGHAGDEYNERCDALAVSMTAKYSAPVPEVKPGVTEEEAPASFPKKVIELDEVSELLAFFARVTSIRSWHEANGGNLSMRLSKASLMKAVGSLPESGLHVKLPVPAPSLSGEYFITTASGSFLYDIPGDVQNGLCLIRIDDDGKGYSLIYAGKDKKPTSELSCHLLSHAARKTFGCKVVYHCHPERLIALTSLVAADDKSITNSLWRVLSESAIVFPEGVGVLEWMCPGSTEIAEASAEKFKSYRLVVWAHHGVLAACEGVKDAFALIDTAEKAAGIALSIAGKENAGVITPQQLVTETKAYGLSINKKLLDI